MNVGRPSNNDTYWWITYFFDALSNYELNLKLRAGATFFFAFDTTTYLENEMHFRATYSCVCMSLVFIIEDNEFFQTFFNDFSSRAWSINPLVISRKNIDIPQCGNFLRFSFHDFSAKIPWNQLIYCKRRYHGTFFHKWQQRSYFPHCVLHK